MEDITKKQLLNAKFVLNEQPILKPFDSFVVADPSVLTPDKAPDKKFHIFFHTNFAVFQAISDDGLKFGKPIKLAKYAMRPNINLIDGKYYLFYEKTRNTFFNLLNLIGLADWKSTIYYMTSEDLVKWSKEKEVLPQTNEFELIYGGGYSLSNPFLTKFGDNYRLYYSCGLTYIKDCGFCEPTYITYAESKDLTSGYVARSTPIVCPDETNPYLNICSGCLKVYKLKDEYIGIQNGIYQKEGHSHSAIIMFSSTDGKFFKYEKMILEPTEGNGPKWLSHAVYASHLVRVSPHKLRLYFNARDNSNPILGRECIGYMEANI